MNNSERDVKQAAIVFTRQLLNLKQDQRLLVYVDQGSDLTVVGAIQDAAKASDQGACSTGGGPGNRAGQYYQAAAELGEPVALPAGQLPAGILGR